MDDRSASGHRFHGLDAIRGIAAILVATRHVPLLAPIEFPESFLAVDLFFVLSGVVLCDAYETRLRGGLSWRSFMSLRVIRLYPLYVLASVVGLVALAIDPAAYPWSAASLVALAIAMIPVSANDLYPLCCPAWSLLLEMVASAAYGVLAKIATPIMLVAIIAASGIGLVALCLAQPSHSLDFGWTLGSMPGGLVRVAFSFATGVLLRHLFDRTPASLAGPARQTAMTFVILLAIVAILVARPSESVRPFLELGAILLAFPVLVFAMLRYEPSGLALRMSAWLGAISYPFYVLHTPLAQIIRHSCSVPQLLAPWSGLVFLTMLLGVCAWLDRAFDRPVRARLMALRESFVDIGRPLARKAV